MEDKYSSIQAFQDDVQLIGDNAKKRHGLESSVTAASDELLEFVNKFMMKLPGSGTLENIHPGLPLTKTKKRKAKQDIEEGEEEESPEPKKIKRPPGTTAQLWKEQKCLAKQKEAYRAATASNAGKIRRNLVFEKLKEVIEEKAKKQKKEAEKKRKAGNGVKFVAKDIDGEQNDRIEGVDGRVGVCERLENKVSNELNGDTSASPATNDDESNENPAEEGQDRQPKNEAAFPDGNMGTTIRIRDYEDQLQRLPTELPTQAQTNSLEHSATLGPNYLGRIASLSRGWNFGQYHRKTNGFTAQDLLLPSADVRDERYCSHNHLTDLTQAEIIYMSGNHLIWKDLYGDEFLSYSRDPFFLVVHAARRHQQKQGDVTIQFIDRRKAKTPDGAPAAFYGALDPYTAFRLPLWGCWGAIDEIKLHPRKFTHEDVTQGPILWPDSSIKQARFEDLIRDGLYDIFPEFEVPENHKYAGLYTLQVVYRKMGYPARAAHLGEGCPPIYSYEECPRAVSMTTKLLDTVRKVTCNFCSIPEGTDPDTVEPPLHAFISFLTFHKRSRSDQVFLDWINEHYSGMLSNAHPSNLDQATNCLPIEDDVRDIYLDAQGHTLPGMTNVADNLPGVMQYLDLLRDCIELFSLTPLPPNNVESHHIFYDPTSRDYTYAAYDARQHGSPVKSHLYESAQHALDKKNEKERRDRKNGKTEGLQEDESKESSSQDLTLAGEIAASDSSDTSLDDVQEAASDGGGSADKSEDEQLLLASTGEEEEEIAAFSRSGEAAIPAEDLAFAHAKPSKGQL